MIPAHVGACHVALRITDSILTQEISDKSLSTKLRQLRDNLYSLVQTKSNPLSSQSGVLEEIYQESYRKNYGVWKEDTSPEIAASIEDLQNKHRIWTQTMEALQRESELLSSKNEKARSSIRSALQPVSKENDEFTGRERYLLKLLGSMEDAEKKLEEKIKTHEESMKEMDREEHEALKRVQELIQSEKGFSFLLDPMKKPVELVIQGLKLGLLKGEEAEAIEQLAEKRAQKEQELEAYSQQLKRQQEELQEKFEAQLSHCRAEYESQLQDLSQQHTQDMQQAQEEYRAQKTRCSFETAQIGMTLDKGRVELEGLKRELETLRATSKREEEDITKRRQKSLAELERINKELEGKQGLARSLQEIQKTPGIKIKNPDVRQVGTLPLTAENYTTLQEAIEHVVHSNGDLRSVSTKAGIHIEYGLGLIKEIKDKGNKKELGKRILAIRINLNLMASSDSIPTIARTESFVIYVFEDGRGGTSKNLAYAFESVDETTRIWKDFATLIDTTIAQADDDSDTRSVQSMQVPSVAASTLSGLQRKFPATGLYGAALLDGK